MADHRLGERPLALVDDQGKVLSADAGAISAGILSGMAERTAVARAPQAVLVPAARYPIQEAHDALLGQAKRYTDRWQPDGPGCVYLDATRVGWDLWDWCQTAANTVRGLGWEPALGLTGSKFGAAVVGQAATANEGLLMISPAQRSFLADQSVVSLPLDIDALTQLRHLGIRTLGQYARLISSRVILYQRE